MKVMVALWDQERHRIQPEQQSQTNEHSGIWYSEFEYLIGKNKIEDQSVKCCKSRRERNEHILIWNSDFNITFQQTEPNNRQYLKKPYISFFLETLRLTKKIYQKRWSILILTKNSGQEYQETAQQDSICMYLTASLWMYNKSWTVTMTVFSFDNINPYQPINHQQPKNYQLPRTNKKVKCFLSRIYIPL